MPPLAVLRVAEKIVAKKRPGNPGTPSEVRKEEIIELQRNIIVAGIENRTFLNMPWQY
jgi:hypothetical protein